MKSVFHFPWRRWEEREAANEGRTEEGLLQDGVGQQEMCGSVILWGAMISWVYGWLSSEDLKAFCRPAEVSVHYNLKNKMALGNEHQTEILPERKPGSPFRAGSGTSSLAGRQRETQDTRSWVQLRVSQ